jgi:HAE1 family hydrophobic/amphiphilic exporter-1
MRLSHFFIDRPIFAAVISIIIVIFGGVSFFRLPIAQYQRSATRVRLPPTSSVGPTPCAPLPMTWLLPPPGRVAR